jgi:uncharacterized protein
MAADQAWAAAVSPAASAAALTMMMTTAKTEAREKAKAETPEAEAVAAEATAKAAARMTMPAAAANGAAKMTPAVAAANGAAAEAMRVVVALGAAVTRAAEGATPEVAEAAAAVVAAVAAEINPMNSSPPLGLGIGWRRELASAILRRADLGFVEILAEDFLSADSIPTALRQLHDRGVRIVPHGVGLSLGSAEPVQMPRVHALARLAQAVQAPLVNEHLAFVRAGGLETGHLLPLPRTRAMLEILIENIHQVEAELPVPLALENIATLFEWPNAEMDEAAFLSEIVEHTDALLLLDIENVYANARNHGSNAIALLEKLPLEKIAYVHVAGGIETAGIYHDTHGQPIPAGVLDLVEALCARVAVPGVMLERDDRFPSESELNSELDAIVAAMQRGQVRRTTAEFAQPAV